MPAKLEDLQPECTVCGLCPAGIATVVRAEWHGSHALTLLYRTASGKVDERLLFREDEERIEIVSHGRPWSFDADGALEVEVTVPAGVPERIQRVMTENCNTLKVDSHDFEDS